MKFSSIKEISLKELLQSTQQHRLLHRKVLCVSYYDNQYHLLERSKPKDQREMYQKDMRLLGLWWGSAQPFCLVCSVTSIFFSFEIFSQIFIACDSRQLSIRAHVLKWSQPGGPSASLECIDPVAEEERPSSEENEAKQNSINCLKSYLPIHLNKN